MSVKELRLRLANESLDEERNRLQWLEEPGRFKDPKVAASRVSECKKRIEYIKGLIEWMKAQK